MQVLKILGAENGYKPLSSLEGLQLEAPPRLSSRTVGVSRQDRKATNLLPPENLSSLEHHFEAMSAYPGSMASQ